MVIKYASTRSANRNRSRQMSCQPGQPVRCVFSQPPSLAMVRYAHSALGGWVGRALLGGHVEYFPFRLGEDHIAGLLGKLGFGFPKGRGWGYRPVLGVAASGWPQKPRSQCPVRDCWPSVAVSLRRWCPISKLCGTLRCYVETPKTIDLVFHTQVYKSIVVLVHGVLSSTLRCPHLP
jgi:hypothetical protein